MERKQDAIIDEVRERRRATEASCGDDWHRLIEHYRKVQAQAARLTEHQPKRLPTAKTPET